MTCWRIYYHVVWATKGRAPLLTPALERLIFTTIDNKSNELKCMVVGLNAVSDHLHVAVSAPPTLAIADWIKHVKGASSHAVNAAAPANAARFYWQSGAGIHTFSYHMLPMIQAYIAKQKTHLEPSLGF